MTSSAVIGVSTFQNLWEIKVVECRRDGVLQQGLEAVPLVGLGQSPRKRGSGSAPPEVSVNMNWTVQTTGLINGKQDYTTVGH